MEINKIFGIKNKPTGELRTPERQSIEQTEDYATKKVVQTQELIVNKIYLNKDSESYFQYNSITGELELYVNGVLVQSW